MHGGGHSRTGSSARPADPTDAGEAEATALRILRGAAQSEAQLRLRLRHRGFQDGAVENAVTNLRRGGWIDDGRLAQAIAGHRRERGYGMMAVRADLRRRGLQYESAPAETEGEDELALTTARKLAPRFAGRADKLAAALQRRGFSGAVVRRAITAVTAEES